MDERMNEAMGIVRRASGWSAGAGLIPIPIVDIGAIAAVQIKMVRDLAKLYSVEFPEVRAKALTGGIAGSILPYLLTLGSSGYLLSLAKGVPLIGTAIAIAAMPGFASASTYAIGKVFAQHFAGGGSLLDFDAEAKKEEIAKEFTDARGDGKKSGSKPAMALRRRRSRARVRPMEPLILGAIYLLACVLVGLVGARRSMGFFAAFFFSLMFTPIVVILILQLTRTPKRYRSDRNRPSTPAR
jgi:uncharacterized protein (DUF697 family)